MRYECEGGTGVVYETSGKTFHSNEPDIVFTAHVDKVKLLFAGKIAERKLHSLVKPRLYAFLGNTDFMACNSDMTNHSLPFKVLHTLVHAGSVAGSKALSRHVELINVDIVCLQIFERCVYVALDLLGS